MENEQLPDFMQPPATPPHPGGRVRVAAVMRSLASGAAVSVIAVAAGQIFLPHDYKPSVILGQFHGDTETAEIEAASKAKVGLEGDMAEARAAPPAKWQIEQQVNAAQMQAATAALSAQAGVANLADSACVMGGILDGLFGSDHGMHEIGHALQQGCGVGDQVRQKITADIAKAARNGSGVVRRSQPDGPGDE